jgi:hypothetical protein
MDYILDYLNNLLETKQTNLVFSSFQNIQTQDPLSKLIKCLNTEKRAAIKIKSEEDILIDDFLYTNNSSIIQLNLAHQENVHKNKDKDNFTVFKTSRRNPNFPTEIQKIILTQLKKVIVYTVVNGNNEIILASPREENNNNSFQWFSDLYYNWFIWKEDEGPINIGLFFLNKEEADSYLHEICLKDPRGAQNIGLNIKSTGLDTFYHLNRTSNPKTQVRLITDLKELDLLLNIHINKNMNIINPKQKYGKNWFKGTPIYILRINDFIKNQNEQKENKIHKKLIFFNKNDINEVLLTGNNKKNLDFKEPNIEIYNLENYLLDLEKSSTEIVKSAKFVPPYLSYLKMGNEISNDNEENITNDQIKKNLTKKMKSVERFCKGVIWLVTSDTLPTEENSW